MSQTIMNQRLNQLLAPQRNNYYYGKLLDENHFRMEQDYINRKRWLINRLGLGAGVLCGLEVIPSKDGKQLCISPGVAIDALGREIIVPEEWRFDPWQITDACGHVKETLSKTEAHEITVCLAYNECYADYAPVLVTDCNEQEQCAPETVRESFCVRVIEIDTPLVPTEVDSKLCEALNAPAAKSSERRQHLCGVTLGACPTPSENACVMLATVKLQADGTIEGIDNCGYRTTVYSNAKLLDMILCLADSRAGGQGPKGDKGDKGDQGDQGDKGDKGDQGDKGDPGVGLDPNLTKVEWINWPHNGSMSIGGFLEGLIVRFNEDGVTAPNLGHAWFLVEIEVPLRPPPVPPPAVPYMYQATSHVLRVLPSSITIRDIVAGTQRRTEATFKPAAYLATVLDAIFRDANILDSNNRLTAEVLCRVIVKCDFVLGPHGRPVDGDLLLGRLPSGDGIPGGDFESWFILTK